MSASRYTKVASLLMCGDCGSVVGATTVHDQWHKSMNAEATTDVEPVDQLNDVPTTQEKLGNVGRSTLLKLMYSGQLKSVKIGSRRFVTDSAIAEYIEGLS